MNVMNPNITMMSVAAGEGWISRVVWISTASSTINPKFFDEGVVDGTSFTHPTLL